MERRYKIAYLTKQQLSTLFISNQITKEIIFTKIKLLGLPSDYEVISIFEDLMRQCFGVVLYSKEFPIVPVAEIIPPINVQVEYINQSWRERIQLL
jgi:hypothetical protein